MIGEVEIHEEEKGFRKIIRPVLEFLKRDWGRLLLSIATFSVISSIIYFSANTSDPIASFTASEYEVNQIADKTIIANRSMSPTEAYPVEVEEGEKIIKKGFPITESAILKLKKLADAPITLDFRSIANSIFFLILVAAFWIVLFSQVILGKRVEMRELVLECVLFTLMYFFAAFAYKYATFQSPFKITVVIASTLSVFLVAILFGQRSAYLFASISAAGIFGATGFQVVPAIFTLATGLSGARIVRHIEKRIDIVFASILQALLSIVFVIVLAVIFNDRFKDVGFVLVGVAVNAFISGILVLGLLTPLENIMNTASVFRLMDLSDTNAETLQKLLINASGTYSHSMMVAQLAENACKKIGANYLLARVAAYYHDIGKLERPEYFTENQDGKNAHDDINPTLSASILKNHVKRGVEEAKRLHLPSQVIDIIAQHHGNSVMAWFYKKAKENDPSVSESDFSYPGTPPITKESAVVMIADTVEAACRSLDDPSVSRLEKFIQQLIDGKIAMHQLDKCGLTFGELSLIKDSFIQILAGHYHSRVKYPGQKDPDQKTPAQEKVDAKNQKSAQAEEKSEKAEHSQEVEEKKEKTETVQNQEKSDSENPQNSQNEKDSSNKNDNSESKTENADEKTEENSENEKDSSNENGDSESKTEENPENVKDSSNENDNSESKTENADEKTEENPENVKDLSNENGDSESEEARKKEEEK